MKRRAFTLLEVLIFLAIFGLTIVGFLSVFLTATRVQTHQTSADEVETQGQFLSQQIQYYIQTADTVDMTQDTSSSALTLTEVAGSLTPTSITLATGTVYLQQGATGTLQALTSARVSVTNMSFTRHFNLSNSSTAFGTDSVSYGFTVTDDASNTTGIYSQAFQSSASVQAPVGKITLLQQATTASNNPVVTSLSAAYPITNATGSLLIAVIANTTSSATILASDTIGNTWTKIANATSVSNTELTIFAALNAKKGANTVTASLLPTAGYATLSIYEYRGASTTSSFDASSTFSQTGTGSPTSSSTNPLSGVELLFGVLYSNPFTQSPTAGAGFQIETTSSVSQTVVEDQTLFITGPVAATWNYASITPSSTAIIVTFK